MPQPAEGQAGIVIGPADRFDAKPEHEFEKGLLPEPPEVSSNLRDFYVDW